MFKQDRVYNQYKYRSIHLTTNSEKKILQGIMKEMKVLYIEALTIHEENCIE